MLSDFVCRVNSGADAALGRGDFTGLTFRAAARPDAPPERAPAGETNGGLNRHTPL